MYSLNNNVLSVVPLKSHKKPQSFPKILKKTHEHFHIYIGVFYWFPNLCSDIPFFGGSIRGDSRCGKTTGPCQAEGISSPED